MKKKYLQKKLVGAETVLHQLSEKCNINFECLKWNMRKIKEYAKNEYGISYDVINSLVKMRLLDDLIVNLRSYDMDDVIEEIKERMVKIRTSTIK